MFFGFSQRLGFAWSGHGHRDRPPLLAPAAAWLGGPGCVNVKYPDPHASRSPLGRRVLWWKTLPFRGGPVGGRKPVSSRRLKRCFATILIQLQLNCVCNRKKSPGCARTGRALPLPSLEGLGLSGVTRRHLSLALQTPRQEGDRFSRPADFHLDAWTIHTSLSFSTSIMLDRTISPRFTPVTGGKSRTFTSSIVPRSRKHETKSSLHRNLLSDVRSSLLAPQTFRFAGETSRRLRGQERRELVLLPRLFDV